MRRMAISNSADEVVHVLIKRKEELEQIRSVIKMRMKEAPPGTLRISHIGTYTQYYHRTETKDTKGKYIKKRDVDLVERLAQKEYDLKVCKEIERQISELEMFLERYQSQTIESVYNNLNMYRKPLITPVYLSDDEYIKRWKNADYARKKFDDDRIELYSDAGERVRSKSEVIIANKLLKMGVTYRYEFPIKLMSGRTVYPDFYCLNVRKREEIIYEHFGMMDDPEYVNKAIKKMEEYQKNGYWLGKNLIVTFETSRLGINVREIEEMVIQYLI